MACCGGYRAARAALKGKTPTGGKRVSWVTVMNSGDVQEFESEIEARAYLASQGGKGNVVRKRS